MLKLHKKSFLILFLSVFLTINCFAMGAGIQTSSVISDDGITAELTGTVRLMRFPIVFGFGWNVADLNNNFYFGFSGFGDYWLLDKQLNNTVNLYAGPGISTRVQSDLQLNWFWSAGLRAVLGVNWLLIDNYIELYAQEALEPSVRIPLSDYSKTKFKANLISDIGIRFHF